METIQLGASAPDVLELVMTDLHERQENVNAVDFRSQKKTWVGRKVLGGLVAAGVAILLISFVSRDYLADREKVEGGFTAFSQLSGAEWLGGEQFSIGEAVPLGRLKLKSGRAVLNFEEGVQVLY
ncbi:hypothetical protein OAM04_00430 [bacterium]|nr:hypothetical protein [bacterium]